MLLSDPGSAFLPPRLLARSFTFDRARISEKGLRLIMIMIHYPASYLALDESGLWHILIAQPRRVCLVTVVLHMAYAISLVSMLWLAWR